MPDLPQRPSLEHLRKQAKARKRERGVALSQAQHELAREYGFDSWPKLVHHVQASGLEGIERALVVSDQATLAQLLPAAATVPVDGLPPPQRDQDLGISRILVNGETRTRTGDTTIFSRYVLAAERREIPGNERFMRVGLAPVIFAICAGFHAFQGMAGLPSPARDVPVHD